MLRNFIISGVFIVLISSCSVQKEQTSPPSTAPNIILMMADDLGYQELGVYGQQLIKTPNLDKLASEGIRFTQFYSGSTVCAPSRCTLLTGKHTGNCYVRDNYELGDFTDENEGGQLPLPRNTVTLGSLLQEQGYRTGVIGKWGLGGPGSSGIPTKQGFDYFYGYLCQKQAHNYYPTHLWENKSWDTLDNQYFHPHQQFEGHPTNLSHYDKYRGNEYSQDVMTAKAMDFIDRHHQEAFFLYLPFTIPHLALQVPHHALDKYLEKFPEEPYLGENGYLPHPYPRAAYAAMITYLDKQIGLILEKLDQNGISDNTLVIFTSDNGTTFDVGGVDRKFFNSLGPLRGHKTTLYEGGIRVPLIIRWPGKVSPGTVTDHISANWDLLPTLAEIVDAKPPADIDGLSILPTILNEEGQVRHQFLYWEYHQRWDGAQAVRLNEWKGVRLGVAGSNPGPIELYNLSEDIAESQDVSQDYPEITEKIRNIMGLRSKSPIEEWNFNGNQL